MLEDDVQVLVADQPWTRGFGLQIRVGTAYATRLDIKEQPDGVEVKPIVSISQDAAQRLFDQLHQYGIRPSRADADSGITATKHHLEDMRRLVFDGKS